MIASPLRKGARWDFNGQAGELTVHQRYDVGGEEDIEVPAGKFYAVHIHGEQTAPRRMGIDPWLASGVGIVKGGRTMRAANVGLWGRISLELAEAAKICGRPE